MTPVYSGGKPLGSQFASDFPQSEAVTYLPHSSNAPQPTKIGVTYLPHQRPSPQPNQGGYVSHGQSYAPQDVNYLPHIPQIDGRPPITYTSGNNVLGQTVYEQGYCMLFF